MEEEEEQQQRLVTSDESSSRTRTRWSWTFLICKAKSKNEKRRRTRICCVSYHTCIDYSLAILCVRQGIITITIISIDAVFFTVRVRVRVRVRSRTQSSRTGGEIYLCSAIYFCYNQFHWCLIGWLSQASHMTERHCCCYHYHPMGFQGVVVYSTYIHTVVSPQQ